MLERYGMTETLMTLSNPYDGERRPGTVGFPFPGVEARVEDDGARPRCAGPTVFSGYWERPAATAESFDDGWFRTGDLGVVEDGYVRLLGRSTELIISGGYNVYPAEVEDVLLGHPSVAEVAVTGAPSEEWGEIVCAWVVPDGASPPDVDALLAYAAQRLAPYKRPRRVRFVDCAAAQRHGEGPPFRVALSANVAVPVRHAPHGTQADGRRAPRSRRRSTPGSRRHRPRWRTATISGVVKPM